MKEWGLCFNRPRGNTAGLALGTVPSLGNRAPPHRQVHVQGLMAKIRAVARIPLMGWWQVSEGQPLTCRVQLILGPVSCHARPG